MTTPALGVNIDHVATLRQARGTSYPSVITAAKEVVAGGADQITVHLREDRRHIQDQDLFDLKKILTVPLNLEMALSEEIIEIALGVRPATVTFVPERREELTTEGGLDCLAQKDRISQVIDRFKKGGVQVSFFIDPDKPQIEMARELQAEAVELHTGRYCEAAGKELKIMDPDPRIQVRGRFSRDDVFKGTLKALKEAAAFAKGLGLKVAAGHGLNYENTGRVVAAIPEIVEYNIGHSIVARAVFAGLKNAVEEMKRITQCLAP